MGQGYSLHVSVTNKKWLFLLDIHWRNYLDLCSDEERLNLVSDLRSTLASSEEWIKSEVAHSLVLVSNISLCPRLVAGGGAVPVPFSAIQQSPFPIFFVFL